MNNEGSKAKRPRMTLKLAKIEDSNDLSGSRQRNKPNKTAIKNCLDDKSEYYAADLYKY